MKKHLLIFLLLGGIVVQAQEKTECELKVIAAENLFKQGLYSESEALVKSTLDSCELKKKNKAEAYELMARLNIENDNLKEANENIRKLLKLNPNYYPDRNRLEEDFIKYVTKYKVLPVLSVGLYAEIAFPKFESVGDPNSILANDFDYTANYKANKQSTIFGLNINFGLPTNTRISFNPGFFTLNYKRTIAHHTIDDYYTRLTETDKFIVLPLEINQHISFRKFTAYVGAGYSYSILSKSSAEVYSNFPSMQYASANYVDLEKANEVYFNESNVVDMKPYRRNIQSMKGQAGITYKISNIILDLRYTYCQSLSLSNSSNYYLPDKIIYRTNYIDNSFYFKYSSVNLSVNYILLHKIKKTK